VGSKMWLNYILYRKICKKVNRIDTVLNDCLVYFTGLICVCVKDMYFMYTKWFKYDRDKL
jgi:hypothetical protein